MAWTQSDIDALKEAIATGASEVRYADGRTVKYRSLAEMKDILDMVTDEANGAEPAPRVSFIAHCRD